MAREEVCDSAYVSASGWLLSHHTCLRGAVLPKQCPSVCPSVRLYSVDALWSHRPTVVYFMLWSTFIFFFGRIKIKIGLNTNSLPAWVTAYLSGPKVPMKLRSCNHPGRKTKRKQRVVTLRWVIPEILLHRRLAQTHRIRMQNFSDSMQKKHF